MLTKSFFHLISLMALCGLLLVGCQRSTGVTVTGTVTFNGQPVPDGSITFSPADGKGPSAGGKIENGKYTVSDVPPGEKIVTVVGGDKIEFPKTSDEMEKMAMSGQKPQSGMQIPPDAKGNNQKITVSSQKMQTIDISLTAP